MSDKLTNMDIAALAQRIQDNSFDNVNVIVSFALGGYGHGWNIQCSTFNANRKLVKSVVINPATENYLESLSEYADNGFS